LLIDIFKHVLTVWNKVRGWFRQLERQYALTKLVNFTGWLTQIGQSD
jgi:hypothetical protein